MRGYDVIAIIIHMLKYLLLHHQCPGHHRKTADEDTLSPPHELCNVAESASCQMLNGYLSTVQKKDLISLNTP